MMGYSDPIKAFYFDRGVWMFGTEIDNALATADASSKNSKFAAAARRRVLAIYLRNGDTKGRFRDPAQDLTKKDAGPVEEDLGDDFSG